jgi:hypothetical protein
VGLDFNVYNLKDIIPAKLLRSFYRMKNEVLLCLYKNYEHKDWYFSVGFRWLTHLYDIEKSGIKIDTNVCFESTVANDEWYKNTTHHLDESNIAMLKFAPFKSKTGRTQIAKDSFRCMNIPKSNVRKSIVSKYPGGKIVSFDFNAADYRCLVAATQDTTLMGLYDGCADFHIKTAELVFGNINISAEQRDMIKKITYISLYGGSIHSLEQSSAQTTESVTKILSSMNFMEPIQTLKQRLVEEYKTTGHIKTYNNFCLKLDEALKNETLLALFGQTQTNNIFMESVCVVNQFLQTYTSKCIFTVHDELVLDMTEQELSLVPEIKRRMEEKTTEILGMKMIVNASVGNNYYEMDKI